MRLSGKVAVVTGSGRGLGLGYARALAAAGAAVVVNDVDPAAVSSAVGSITASGGRAAGVTAAVGDQASASLLVDTAIGQFGRLDVMITNAGILRDRVLWKMTDDDFDSVVNVHLRGTFTCARAAAVHMRAQGSGGRIIVVSSPAGQRGNFGQTNYAAAKAGIAAMARTWALELARAGVTVNAVVPVAATEMTKTIPAFAPAIEEAERTGTPFPAWMRRDEGMGSVDDVTGLIVFLSSDDAREITGQAIGIGGDRLTLWTHPAEKTVAFSDGGWTAEAIAAEWSRTFAPHLETYGIPAPNPPAAPSAAAPPSRDQATNPAPGSSSGPGDAASSAASPPVGSAESASSTATSPARSAGAASSTAIPPAGSGSSTAVPLAGSGSSKAIPLAGSGSSTAVPPAPSAEAASPTGAPPARSSGGPAPAGTDSAPAPSPNPPSDGSGRG